jgi:hypothetical protein
MNGMSVSWVVITFLAVLWVGLVARGGQNATPDPNNTRTVDLAGIEKLRRSDIEATLTQDPAALNTLWSDEGVNLQVPERLWWE